MCTRVGEGLDVGCDMCVTNRLVEQEIVAAVREEHRLARVRYRRFHDPNYKDNVYRSIDASGTSKNYVLVRHSA